MNGKACRGTGKLAVIENISRDKSRLESQKNQHGRQCFPALSRTNWLGAWAMFRVGFAMGWASTIVNSVTGPCPMKVMQLTGQVQLLTL
jgi:hypothetical protein